MVALCQMVGFLCYQVQLRLLVFILVLKSSQLLQQKQNPEQSVAKATQSVITRVLLFYVCSIFLVVCLVPWSSPDIATPYVSALKVLNIPFVADIMNAVIFSCGSELSKFREFMLQAVCCLL